jgi:Ran GTPase-activating protein (RanGAP) involved in mRNA processing and transport
MTVIPEGIPAETLQLNLNGNAFSSGIVGRSNFSRYVNLQHLYMSECGLEQLQVDTFVDLVELRWLDLSNNRLKVCI